MLKLNRKIEPFVKAFPGYRLYKIFSSLKILSRTELELLADPWYHNFEVLGFNTPFKPNHWFYRQNQECKQGPLFDLINRAIQLCKIKGETTKGVELFCADGFYSNFALRCGAESIYGIDTDGHEIEKARLMARLLGNSKKAKFEQGDVFGLSGNYDFGICAGGLYHLSDPAALLASLLGKIKVALVIQTVVSIANTSPDYFETPAPGWNWGCRFSYDYLLRIVREAGWIIQDEFRNEFTALDRPEDKGSAYLLCVPAR